jgi:dipeptidyl aminopeptidase/acylaminoacyl peptidase
MNPKIFRPMIIVTILVMLIVISASSVLAQAAVTAPSGVTQEELTHSLQATPAAAVPQAEVIVAALNVRAGPGVNYRILEVAFSGDKFEVIGVNAARTWLQIVRTDGSRAWISGWPAYTRVSTSLDGLPVVQAPPISAAQSSVAVPAVKTGGKLVFMTTSGGSIYVINADGTGLRLLLNGGLDPALSPDGQQVAFTRWGPTEGVYLINIDGSNERQVHAARQPKSPTWSADGIQLIFNLQHGGRLDTTKECKFSSSEDEPDLPPDAYDVDRKTIIEGERYEFCYWLPPKPGWALRQLDLTTGQFKDLSSDFGSFGPTWDPVNGWRVVYTGDVSLVQLDLNQNTRVSVAAGTRDRTPAFSPDGSRLALAHKQENDQWAIQVINMTTNERTQLTLVGNNISPTWSPDGTQIAFLSDRSGRWDIWVMNADGTQQRPMFAPGTLADINFEFHEVDERMISWGP